jgi:hypothetical protein
VGDLLFFSHSSGVSVRSESNASQARDSSSWALLITRLVDVAIDPNLSDEDNEVTGAPHLKARQEEQEATVYRLVSNPEACEAIIFAHVWVPGDPQGQSWQQINSESIRRDNLR